MVKGVTLSAFEARQAVLELEEMKALSRKHFVDIRALEKRIAELPGLISARETVVARASQTFLEELQENCPKYKQVPPEKIELKPEVREEIHHGGPMETERQHLIRYLVRMDTLTRPLVKMRDDLKQCSEQLTALKEAYADIGRKIKSSMETMSERREPSRGVFQRVKEKLSFLNCRSASNENGPSPCRDSRSSSDPSSPGSSGSSSPNRKSP